MKHEKKHLEKEHESKADFTPMIDLVLILVMFFVVTSTFTSLNLEDVLLPMAKESADMGEERVIIINVREKKDTTSREGEIVFNSEVQTQESLRKDLDLEVKVDAQKRGMQPSPVEGGEPLSKLEVLVRADQGVRGEYLRQIFVACQQVGIYKMKLGALQP